LFSAFFRRHRRPAPVTPATAVMMTQEERRVVRRFAQGDDSLADRALEAYRSARGRGVSLGSEAAMRFMSEVDHPVPDLGFRAMMRREVAATTV
jgi:hypothetical protein